MSTRRAALLALAALLLAIPAAAPAEPEQLKNANEAFDHGKYEEAIRLIDEANDKKLLASEADLVDAWRIHGLAHFYLSHRDEARASFTRLLFIDPDYTLDPLLVPPGAIAELDDVRKEKEPKLASIRETRRAIAELKRKQEDERRKLLEDEERRRREKDAPPALLQRVERHSILTNFLPFGAAQIEQGRSQVGAMIAIGQALALTGTVVTYSQTQGYLGTDGKVDPNKVGAATKWRTANWITFGLSAAIYLGGVLDAVLHFQDETVSYIPINGAPPAKAPAPRPADARPTTNLFLSPTPGGLAAGVSGRF
jgi:tetratricopeptide (TPR) repeat protein